MNLLTETQEAITRSGHTITDIIFIGSEASGHSCTWTEFCTLANFDYDDGFGGQEIATDLIIVFADGQKMWRCEYDGSEWWGYSTPFKRPEVFIPIRWLGRGMWDTLAQLHEENSQ
jgi:hypothetical protein